MRAAWVTGPQARAHLRRCASPETRYSPMPPASLKPSPVTGEEEGLGSEAQQVCASTLSVAASVPCSYARSATRDPAQACLKSMGERRRLGSCLADARELPLLHHRGTAVRAAGGVLRLRTRALVPSSSAAVRELLLGGSPPCE